MLLSRYLPETAACVLIFLFSFQIAGAIGIVLEFAVVGLLLVARPKTFLQTILHWWPLLLTPLLAMASTLWSSAPDNSLRYGTQLLFTFATAMFLARLLSPRQWLIAFFVATFVFCLASIASMRTGISATGMVLIGLTGSKNSMSNEAQMLLLSGLAVLLLEGVSRPLRLAALVSLPLAAALVVVTSSATSAILVAIGAPVILFLWLSQRLTPAMRLSALLFGAVMLIPIFMLAPEIGALRDHILYDTLDKDPTLTGRTLLWARADDLIARKPFLGHGYLAIWTGDTFDSIGLKRLTGIEDGRMFHFHNTWRQVAVDLGLTGLAIFAGTLIVSLLKGLAQALVRPTVATSFFFVTLSLIVATGFADTILQPFLLGTVLLTTCCVYAFARPEPVAQAAPDVAPRLSRFAPAERPA